MRQNARSDGEGMGTNVLDCQVCEIRTSHNPSRYHQIQVDREFIRMTEISSSD